MTFAHSHKRSARPIKKDKDHITVMWQINMKKSNIFLKSSAALAMILGVATTPIHAEETTNNAANYTETQEADYNTHDTHSEATNDKVSGRAATTDHNGAVSSATGDPTAAASSSKSTDVLYQVAEGYTWTIHSLVDFGDSKGTNNTSTVTKTDAIKVTRNVIPDGKKLSITLDASNTYTVANGGTKLSYVVANDATGTHLVAGTDEVMSVSAGTNTGTTDMLFKLSTTNGTAEVAGDYTGTIGYVASIVDAH